MSIFKKSVTSTDRYDLIVEVATRLFVENSFEETTMQQIADEASVGIENLYDYFTTKRDLLFTVALSFWHKEFLVNEDVLDDKLSGIESIEKLIDEEYRIFSQHPERYVFLEKFDNYVKNYLRTNQIKDIKQVEFLERYEKAVQHDENIWKMVILSGLSDNTLRSDLDIPLTLYTLSIMEMAVFQKLTNRRVVIEQDKQFETDAILMTLKTMILDYLKG